MDVLLINIFLPRFVKYCETQSEYKEVFATVGVMKFITTMFIGEFMISIMQIYIITLVI